MIKRLFAIVLYLLIVSNLSFGQNLVKGVILDDNGEVLPGASITEIGTSNVAFSNFEGEFSIVLSSDSSRISISFIDFYTKVLIPDFYNKMEIKLTLKPEIEDDVRTCFGILDRITYFQG